MSELAPPREPVGPVNAVSGKGAPGRRLRQLAGIPVDVLRGVGAVAQDELGALGIATVLDLLTYYPRRYVDGSHLVTLGQLTEGAAVSVVGEVRRVRSSGGTARRGRGISRVELEVVDESGSLRVVFFGQPWRVSALPEGTLALFYGKVTRYRDVLQMASPTVEVLGAAPPATGSGRGGGAGRRGGESGILAGRVYPVYPLSERSGLTSVRIARYVAEALDRAGELADPLDDRWRDDLGLLDRTAALRGIHQPATPEDVEPARRRLAFDELLRLQLVAALKRARMQRDARGIAHVVRRPDGAPTLVDRFLGQLPFEPTGAQRRAIDAICADLAGGLPMHRLLQGDVGAGKTVVALAALLVAVQGGYQGALMAPTEVLADQHALGIRRMLAGLTVADPGVLGGSRPPRLEVLTSRTPAKARSAILEGTAAGTVDLLVGTHALLEESVTFAALGVAVIDEQHRFGVEQRAALRAKGHAAGGRGQDPDLLVMTATPIPRTAAMVVFGDLDMTVVDELPAGRLPVATEWARTPAAARRAWERVRSEVAAGRRAFVVCPLVEGSELTEATSVTDEMARLAAGELAGLRLGLLHGQLRSAEKEQVMAAFRAGSLDVLVATTVIEVGVDVPEATVMVIEDADRFGIAQLHQLRGRVGRGGDPSWCYLLSSTRSPEAEERLRALERSNDGFELAEIDLSQRGEGTILGVRQKGRSDLRLASVTGDGDLVTAAAAAARSVVAGERRPATWELLEEELRIFIDDDDAEFLFKS